MACATLYIIHGWAMTHTRRTRREQPSGAMDSQEN
eukprot:CAMPEP_0176144672 /NCGR_PEP_ID=MMETSP0120_2-20121206/73671_1 /TAXON_ID=160619 /ORGANISM="Kryptoperidinium foliaceum, Strain CCMP 1326" /LENGTH=34 /DNA_ID= /DNA_START= /DNA_END= /DNA_ORIENTATION=